MTNTNGIAAKIRALLSKTTANGSTEAEALSAMAKASELMEKHSLSITEVELREEECVTVTIDTGRRSQNAMRFVMTAIARFCDCKVWACSATRNTNVEYKFFGLPHDTEIAAYLYEMIQNTMNAEAKMFKETDTYIFAKQYRGGRRRASNSFEIGFTSRISQRLRSMKNDSDQSVASTGTDLVSIKGQLVNEEFAKLGMRLTQTQSKTYISGSASNAGQAAGSRASINRGVRQSSSSTLAIT